MEVAVSGLGRMGAGMARRLARGGHDVVVWNRTEQVATDLAAEPENDGRVRVVEPLERLAEMTGSPRHVIISVPAEMLTVPGQAACSCERGTATSATRNAAPRSSRSAGSSGSTWAFPAGFGG